MAKRFLPQEYYEEGRKRRAHSILEPGDQIAVLPYDFLGCSMIPYGVERTLGNRVIETSYDETYVEKGIICAINRVNSSNKEFTPYILPLSYIVSRWLFYNGDRSVDDDDEEIEIRNEYANYCRNVGTARNNPDKTLSISVKISSGVDTYCAIQCDKVYTVSAIGETTNGYTWISLYESDCSIYFNGIDCSIGGQVLDKQVFNGYIEECIHSEELLFADRYKCYHMKEQDDRRRREFAAQEERRKREAEREAERIAEQIKKREAERRIEEQKRIEAEKVWKGAGNVVLCMRAGEYKGEMQFKQYSINELQYNVQTNSFRIKTEDPYIPYWDLQRTNISNSIFTRQWAYQVIRFKHFYVLEDLARRVIK